MRFSIVFVYCIFQCLAANAQHEKMTFPRFNFLVDAGIDHAVGRTTISTKQGVINTNAGISYWSSKRFENPGIRLRLSAMYSKNPDFMPGIQTGLTLHTGELFGDSKYKLLCMPVQIRVIGKLVHFNYSNLFFDGAGGMNIFRDYKYAYSEHTGPLFSLGLLLFLKNNINIRGGFEHQTDLGTSRIFADPLNNIKEEIIHYLQKREVVFISVGIKLK